MSHTVSGNTTNYTWDAATNLPVIPQGGTTTYVYGLDLISATDATGGQAYYLYDGLGSTTGLTDSSGNAIASWSYDAFGAIRAQSGTSNNSQLFAGEQLDPQTSLYYLRARYYDPQTGRFLGRDPAQAGHPYVYADNNPVNAIDPNGLRCWGFCDPIEAVVDRGKDAAVWWGEQVADDWIAAGEYAQNVYQHPLSTPQESVGLMIAWGSLGNRSREGGVTEYRNCLGFCSWQRLFGKTGWALGHTIFYQTNPGCNLREHEHAHVGQSEQHGPFWIPKYFIEEIPTWFAIGSNRYEQEAARLAFSICPPSPYE
jgi:RHS repeat-associated protein